MGAKDVRCFALRWTASPPQAVETSNRCPSLIRALGARASRPAEVVVPDLGAHPALDRLARHAIAGSVVQLLQQDAVVCLGNSRHELWPALRRAWHGGLGSQRPRGCC
jgi:hypothetical protein